MRRRVVLAIAMSVACVAAARAGEGRVAVAIPLHGRVDDFMVEAFGKRMREAHAEFRSGRFRRSMRDIDRHGEGKPVKKPSAPDVVLLDLHTTGGTAAATLYLADDIHGLSRDGIVTAAVVRAPASPSTTLLALACEHVFFTDTGRLAAVDPQGFDPKATEKEREELLASLRWYCQERPRLKPLYVAFAEPADEVHAVVFEGREGQPAFYGAEEFKRVRASDQAILRSERVVAKGKRAELTAAVAERIGLSGGTVATIGAAATRLKIPGNALTMLKPVGTPKKPTTAVAAKPSEKPKKGAEPKKDEEPKGKIGPVGDGDTVAVIRLEGVLGHAWLYSVRRRLEIAQALNPALIIFDIDTPGGRVDHMLEIGKMIFAVEKTRTVAFINDKALSAGSIISLACDEIVMQRGSQMGSAQIITGQGEAIGSEKIEEKFASVIRTRVRTYCEGKFPAALAVAMVSLRIEVYQATTADGKTEYFTDEEWENQTPQERERFVSSKKVVTSKTLLNMDDTKAREYGFSRATVRSHADILKLYGLEGRKVQLLEISWSEIFVRALDTVGPVLMVLGIIAIVIELKTPGFGVFGLTGVVLLGVFFLGKYTVGLAEIWEIALFAVGIMLLAVEIFVTPGFGVLGITGMLCMLTSLILSLQSFVWPDTPIQWNDFQVNLLTVGTVLIVSFVAIVSLARYLHRAPYLGKLVLVGPVPTAEQRSAVSEAVSPLPSPEREKRRSEELVGRKGTSTTLLRPAGRGEFDGEPLDVVTEGDFIQSGEPIEICKVRGNRVVVRRAT